MVRPNLKLDDSSCAVLKRAQNLRTEWLLAEFNRFVRVRSCREQSSSMRPMGLDALPNRQSTISRSQYLALLTTICIVVVATILSPISRLLSVCPPAPTYRSLLRWLRIGEPASGDKNVR